MRFKIRYFIGPFTYIYRKFYDLIHNSKNRWNYESAKTQSLNENLQIQTEESDRNPFIQPPFPLKIRIPPD